MTPQPDALVLHHLEPVFVLRVQVISRSDRVINQKSQIRIKHYSETTTILHKNKQAEIHHIIAYIYEFYFYLLFYCAYLSGR